MEFTQLIHDIALVSGNEANTLLETARQLHLAGHLIEAERIYRQILQDSSAPPLAFHGLGVLLARREDFDESLPLLRHALEAAPNSTDFWLDYAATFLIAGQPDEANLILIQARKHGIDDKRCNALADRIAPAYAANPDYANIRQLFNQVKEGGDYRNVEQLVRQQIDRFGPRSRLLQLLGTILLRQQRNTEALTCFDQALNGAPPPYPLNLYNQRAIVLQRLGRHAEAEQTYQQALALDENQPSIWINLASNLNDTGRYTEAILWLEKALIATPYQQEARVNLAVSYIRLERYAEAHSLLRIVLAAGHTSVVAHLSLAEILFQQGLFGQALTVVRQIQGQADSNPEFYASIIRLLLRGGAVEEAVALRRQFLPLKFNSPKVVSNLLFSSQYYVQPADKLFELARTYGELVRVTTPYTRWQRTHRHGTARLRLGLVSGDFITHPVGYFLESVLQQLQGGQFELFAYHTRYREDDFTINLKPLFSTWRSLAGLDDEAAARLIHEDNIDILIDLSGHTDHHRLPVFAWRPAPLQVSWLGYFATTGMTEIDYLLADKVGVPPQNRRYFTEQVAYLPDTRLCFSIPRNAPPVSIAPCVSRGFVTFGSFQNLSKLSTETLNLWAAVLQVQPNSRLRLQANGLQDTFFLTEFQNRMSVSGLPLERVDFASSSLHTDYLAAYAEVDLLLDTFPYPGGTTTCEALWMGVPTLTLAGDSLLSRQGASLLIAAGLRDWVAYSTKEYLVKARKLTSDVAYLTDLRAEMRQRVTHSSLFDAKRFAHHFEILLGKLWRKTGQPRIKLSTALTPPTNFQPRSAEQANVELAEVVALYQKGHCTEALPRARLLAKQFPTAGVIWKVLGVLLTAIGSRSEAMEAKRRAVELTPDDPDAHANLGNTLQDEDLLDEAELHCRAALAINPRHDNALNNLGLILFRRGRFQEARQALEQALAFCPDFPEAMVNLGNVLRDTGDANSAEHLYRQAARLSPNLLNAHMNLGVLLTNTSPEHWAEAEAAYQRALEINPLHVETLNGLGNLYVDLRRFQRAERCFARAVELNPSHARAWLGLGGVKSYAKGDLHEAIACFEQALRNDPDMNMVRSALLFNHAYMGDTEPAEHLYQARLYGDAVARLARPFTKWSVPLTMPIRIGLIGGDFRNHPVGFFLESLLRHLDRSLIEVYIYSNNEKNDEMTTTLQSLTPCWMRVRGVHDAVLAKSIHEQGIHILIDMAGHTGDNRLSLFPWRAAPVQVAWLGYFATTGVAEIDWLIADETGVPPENQWHFCEKIWYLPNTRLCFSQPHGAPDITPLRAKNNGQVTFGCVQNLTKVNNYTLHLWKRVMDALPEARLCIQTPQFADMQMQDNFRSRMLALGIDTLRIKLLPPSNRIDYLEKMADIDLMLDTFPYPGGTTTCEALWMGVPTLTLLGDTLLSRQGASLLKAGGLPEWVAHNEDEYVAKAIAFANDISGLATLRLRLRNQIVVSKLFDAAQFSRNFEQAMLAMWTRFATSFSSSIY